MVVSEAVGRGRRNEMSGKVVSAASNKTISVEVYRTFRHTKYGKTMRRIKIFRAHDEENIAQVGDKVLIYETRPLSKTKRWKLVEVLEKAKI